MIWHFAATAWLRSVIQPKEGTLMIITFIYLLFLSTNCVQDFSFIGATNTKIWIVEHVGGQCHYSKLMQLSYSDTSITSVELKVVEYKQTDDFINSFAQFDKSSAVEISILGDSLTDSPQLSFSLKPPKPDSAVLAKCFRDGVLIYPLSIILPIFSGVQGQLLYQYDACLYVNYQIDRVYFVPAKNILIIFTKNALLKSSGDTMNGFMIFHIQR